MLRSIIAKCWLGNENIENSLPYGTFDTEKKRHDRQIPTAFSSILVNRACHFGANCSIGRKALYISQDP